MRSARRWAGPPPLLIALTVLGIVVAPAVSSADEGTPGPPTAQVRLAAGPGTLVGPVALSGPRRSTSALPSTSTAATAVTAAPPSAARATVRAPAPAPRPRTVGVVSFNEFRRLTRAEARSDADAITARRAVDVVGWQEGYSDAPVYRSLRGWTTKRFGHSARELAVSWRSSRFRLVRASQQRVSLGVDGARARYPFGDTFVLRVTLRDRASGLLLTVLDTHLPHKIEDLVHPGHWTDTVNAARARQQLAQMAGMWAHEPGRWVIGTGDYNFDARSDAERRPAGGLTREFAGHAVSSYAALGRRGVLPTHPYSGRYIDYVHVAKKDLDAHRVAFVDQHSISGLNSDHRALLVRLRLS